MSTKSPKKPNENEVNSKGRRQKNLSLNPDIVREFKKTLAMAQAEAQTDLTEAEGVEKLMALPSNHPAVYEAFLRELKK